MNRRLGARVFPLSEGSEHRSKPSLRARHAPSNPNHTNKTPVQCSAVASAAAADDYKAAATPPKARTIVGGGVLGIITRVITGSNPWGILTAAAVGVRDNIGGAIVGTVKAMAAYNTCMADSLGSSSWSNDPVTGH